MKPFIVLGWCFEILFHYVHAARLDRILLGLIDLCLMSDWPAFVLILGMEKDSSVGPRFGHHISLEVKIRHLLALTRVVDHGRLAVAFDRTVLDRNTFRIPFIDFPIVQVLPVKQKFPTIGFFGFG